MTSTSASKMTSTLPRQRPHELPELPPEQRWLIEPLWGHQAVGIIGGEPKCCKSLLALEMAVAVARGGGCLGRYATTHPGSVLLYAAEDASHIVRERLAAICRARSFELDTLDIWVITAPTVRLDTLDDRQKLAATVAADKPALLVLDPFVRLHRVDENASSEVAPLLAFLRELQRDYGCAVVLVHHARKGGAAMREGQALRGSSELHAWGDSNLYLRRNSKGLWMSIEHRAAPSQSGIALDLRTDDSGSATLFVTDHVDDSRQTRGRQTAPAHERVLDCLRSAAGPLRTRPLRDTCRIKAATLSQTLAELEAAGVILRTDDGWVAQERLPGGDSRETLESGETGNAID